MAAPRKYLDELRERVTRMAVDVRKIHAELNREGVPVARCTVDRLMRADGLRGIPREKTRKTTIGDSPRPSGPRTWWTGTSAPSRRTSCG